MTFLPAPREQCPVDPSDCQVPAVPKDATIGAQMQWSNDGLTASTKNVPPIRRSAARTRKQQDNPLNVPQPPCDLQRIFGARVQIPRARIQEQANNKKKSPRRSGFEQSEI